MTKSEAMAVLGLLEEPVGTEELRKAYRAAAEKWHPDRKSGDQVKFQEAAQARKVLEKIAVECKKCGGSGKIEFRKGFYATSRLCDCRLGKRKNS